MRREGRKYFCSQLRLNFLLLIFIQLLTSSLSALADWTFLLYVQANNNLSSFADKNFTDMATIGSNDNLNILVEWHQPKHAGAWRYKIEKKKMTFDSCIPNDSDGNSAQDLVQAVAWAKAKYPAKKYALVLWDHGLGIIDPRWGRYRQVQNTLVDPLVVKENPRIQIDGLTFDKNDSTILPSSLTTDFATDLATQPEIRGILFNETSKTYMTNQILTAALSEIQKTVLNGKKIDLIGMDACLMAMVEVGYQIRKYADFFVASEEVELAHGWYYSSFLNMLKNNTLTPTQLAQAIVLTYDHYYKNKVQFYTQAAIKLENMDVMKLGIDAVVEAIQKCKGSTSDNINTIIKKARNNCLQFSAPNYVDLHSFLSELFNQVNGAKQLASNKNFDDLKQAITACIKIVDNSILANSVGSNMGKAHGLSIYYPTLHIDDSYVKTEFAKESLWLNFLQDFIAL